MIVVPDQSIYGIDPGEYEWDVLDRLCTRLRRQMKEMEDAAEAADSEEQRATILAPYKKADEQESAIWKLIVGQGPFGDDEAYIGSPYSVEEEDTHLICSVCGERIADSEEGFRGVGRHDACVHFNDTKQHESEAPV